jgi:hypothetical protein
MGLRFICVAGWGSWKMAVALLGRHTPWKNPRPISACKHTSLTRITGDPSEVRLSLAQKPILVTRFVTL